MLIESLVRLGKPLMEGGMTPEETLRLISDVDTPFLAHVIVVEISNSEENFRAVALPVQEWGNFITTEGAGGSSEEEEENGDDEGDNEEKESVTPTSRSRKNKGKGKAKSKENFRADVQRGVGTPFVLPKGGNPRAPQGYYGVPVYPIYDEDLRGFPNDGELIGKFLAARVKRTLSLKLTEAQIQVVAKEIQRTVQDMVFPPKKKVMGILALVAPDSPDKGFYIYQEKVPQGNPFLSYLGESQLYPGKRIVANLEAILKGFLTGRIYEGIEGGEIKKPTATCAFCGGKGHVLSAYCKAWPWFLPEWSCPQPIIWEEKKEKMVLGIALCPTCYQRLLYGANIFMKLARQIETWLTKEIFSPVASARGKEQARAKKMSDPIYGCAFVLPLLEKSLTAEEAEDFASGMRSMLIRQERTNKLDIHLREITGFESLLPEEFLEDENRLTLIYFSGAPERGNIHLRAVIEDVIPSTARQVRRLTVSAGGYALDTLKHLQEDVSDVQAAFIRRKYSSLIYLLNTAFGGPYLWLTLANVMHRAPLSRERFIANSARRMEELSHGLPDTRYDLREEVIFYLTFAEFLREYQAQILKNGRKEPEENMRDWQELQQMLDQQPPEEIRFCDEEELGFGCGHLVALFSRQYWAATKEGEEGKDFLKHRVMTFGSDLSPEAIWKRGLVKMEEYARRLDMHLSGDFRKRLGVILTEYSRLRGAIANNRDAFMAAFWAGYTLAGVTKASTIQDPVAV